MNNQAPPGRSSLIFLVLGLAFLATGIAADQTAFTWIAIAFVLIALINSPKRPRPGK
jgi:hypothetical protein